MKTLFILITFGSDKSKSNCMVKSFQIPYKK